MGEDRSGMPLWFLGLFAIMCLVMGFGIGLSVGFDSWRQECDHCRKERPHLKFYLCPECKAAMEKEQKEVSGAL